MFPIEKRPDANNVQTAVELKAAAAALLVSPVEWNIKSDVRKTALVKQLRS